MRVFSISFLASLLLMGCGKDNESPPPQAFSNGLGQSGEPVVTEVQSVSKQQATSFINFKRSTLVNFQVGEQFQSNETYTRRFGELRCNYVRNLTKTIERDTILGGMELSIQGESRLQDSSPSCQSQAAQTVRHNHVRRINPIEVDKLIARIERTPGESLSLQLAKSQGQDILVMQVSRNNIVTKRYMSLDRPIGLGLIYLRRTSPQGTRVLNQYKIR